MLLARKPKIIAFLLLDFADCTRSVDQRRVLFHKKKDKMS